ncbi:MAG TPA: hypothetical protein VM509_06825 [Planctomycetota bacterium]|nr:hypothetical protein [Planctomycetota bacterium]
MQGLLRSFVVCADEVGRLQRGKDPECVLAQKVFEQGHYAGRTQPTDTRQGIYATAPSGVMLASVNANEAKPVADMLRRALDKWTSLTEAERMRTGDPRKETGKIDRAEKRYPTGGLVLRVFSRDLPRDASKPERDWRTDAWNQDYAWFKPEEARALLPKQLHKGAKAAVPEALVRRLARLNFVDNVRGQTIPYEDADVAKAELFAEVLRVEKGVASVQFRGATRARREGVWVIEGIPDKRAAEKHAIGMELALFGTAEYDTKKDAFVAFDVVALGLRSGATQYNGRYDDQEPAPIGFSLGLAGDTPAEHVAPAFYWEYGWR